MAAVFGPLLSPYSYTKQSLIFQNTPPSLEHWFGTDNVGRDLLVRCFIWGQNFISCRYFCDINQSDYWGFIWWNLLGLSVGKVDTIHDADCRYILCHPTAFMGNFADGIVKAGITKYFDCDRNYLLVEYG